MRVGARAGTVGSAGPRRSICSASVPRLSLMMARATAWKRSAVFLGYLVGGPDEDAAGSILQVSVGAGGDESHDLVVQRLPVAGMVFVPDHQVDGQSLEPPVRVGLDKLAHQLDVRLIFNAKKHDRKIAGDGITPEARLAPEVLQKEAGALREALSWRRERRPRAARRVARRPPSH